MHQAAGGGRDDKMACVTSTGSAVDPLWKLVTDTEMVGITVSLRAVRHPPFPPRPVFNLLYVAQGECSAHPGQLLLY